MNGKIKYFSLAIFPIMLGPSKSFCQDPQTQLEKVIPISPTAASIAKYGNMPVNYFTGSPNITIPLFNVQSGSLQVPVTLNYQFSGLKVEEIASWVGLGWSLQAGGAVSRTVRGTPDEEGYGYMSPTIPMKVKYIMDNLVNPATKDAINWYLTEAGQGRYDLEPDIFYFNFPGGSGKFFFNQEEQKFFTLPAQKINIGYSVTGFVITTPDGNRYHFAQKEFTTTNPPQCSGSLAQAGNSTVTTSWYLSKIENKTQTDSVTFEYSALTYSFDNIAANSKYILFNQTGQSAGAAPDFSSQLCFQTTNINALKLEFIRFRNGYLKFVHSSMPREDLPGDKALEKVELYNSNNEFLKRYLLSYEYFGSGTALEKRLKLKQVKEEGAGATPTNPYLITYEENGLFPSRLSYAQDHWGYYNGATTNQNLIPTVLFQNYSGKAVYVPGDNRKPNFSFAQLGAIKTLTYPTGGYTTLEFENNEVKDSVIQPEYNLRTEHVEGDHNGGVPTLYMSNYFTINEAPNYYNFKNVNGGAYVDASFDAVNCDFSNGATTCAALTVIDQNGNVVLGPLTSNIQGFYLPNGTYRLKATFGQSSPTHQDFYFSIAWKQPVLNNSNLIGGIRLKRMTDYDGIDVTKKTIRRFTYTSDTDGLSSGKVCGYPNSYAMDFQNEHISSMTTSNSCMTLQLFRTFKKYTSTSNYPLIAHQGGYVGYEQVNVLNGDAGENGKTVYRYQYFYDIIGAFPTTVTSREWNRGLLLEERQYRNSTGNFSLIGKDSISYGNLGGLDPGLLSIAYGLKASYNRSVTVSAGCAGAGFSEQRVNEALKPNVTEYETVTNNSPVQFKSTVNFEQSSSLKGWQQFSYNAKNYLSKETKTLNSKGDTLITRYKYNIDYTPVNGNPLWLNQLSLKNISVFPIEKLVVKKSPGSAEYLLAGTVNVYKNDRPLPEKLFTLDIAAPVLMTSYTPSYVDGSGNFIKDSRYREVALINTYDQYNNILSQQKANDYKTGYVWDYASSYPVAEVINADTASIAYTSFESSGKGYWTFSGSPVLENTSPTGRKAYLLNGSNNLTRSGLVANVVYIVSYWTKNTAALTIPGTISGFPLQGRSVNGWQYFEHRVTAQTQITIAGSGYIDEVRLYPSAAQMETFTYDPFVGMTSKCDVNNRITYYDYDDLERLALVRDQDRNIIKKYCYNYAGQTENCGVVLYVNVVKSGAFTRNNCITGGVGGTVVYTVNAGKYSSTISQVDADQLAQNDVNTNGQAYANTNGTCTFYNVSKSGTFTKNNCSTGGVGSTLTYTVSANVYSSTISQADADQKAQTDVSTNGQAYANQNGTCTWYNAVKSGTFTRNNCPAGYFGSTVTYTVNQGVYSSVISQADADQKALNDVNVNGQAYANTTGTCTPQGTYARMEFSNYYWDIDVQYATVVIKFYSDAACTISKTVSNLSVNYQKVKTLCSGSSTTTNFTVVCTGSQYSLGTQIITWDNGSTKCEDYNFYTTAGTGYTASPTKY